MTCGQCKWWVSGECHRYPKAVGEKFLGGWPNTKTDDFCGEFTSKYEQEEQNNGKAVRHYKRKEV